MIICKRCDLEIYTLGVFLLLSITSPTAKAVTVHDVLDIAKFTKDVVIWIGKTWSIVDSQVKYSEDVPMPLFDKAEQKLFSKIDIISSRIETLNQQIESVGTTTISVMLSSLPEKVRLELRLNDLLTTLTFMDVYYKTMQQYSKHRDEIEKQTLEDFTNTVVSHNANSVSTLMERIHSFIVPNGNDFLQTGLLKMLNKNLKEVEGDMFCNALQSPQQVLFNLYNTIALCELKGYTMIQFAYMLKKLYNQGNFTKEAELAKQRFQQRTNNLLLNVKSAMKISSNELWKCDPKKHINNETFIEITQLLQGYVQNEVDLNPDRTCRENCAEYTYTKSHGCFKNLYCNQQRRCNGKIINCRFVDSDMWICPADIQTSRRYEYIEYENGRVLGRKQGCRRGTSKVDSWWRWLFWHCSYCFCLCDEQSVYSDRYFNMRAAVADVENNRVLTGLRFVKHNRLIHLQIQEGLLLPRGHIDSSTLHWVPVEDYRITDPKIYNGQDYHTLTWEKRAMDLDDLFADDGYIVTGVRFKLIGSHLNFEILTSPFNFESGKLIEPLSKSVYKDNPNTDSSFKNPRSKVQLAHPDIPIRTSSPSVPDSKHDQYVEFTHTDIDRDAAQTTVPYIDAQPVESLNPVPLVGAGIFHKGRRNFGGFIAPKIFTFDMSENMQPAFPDQEPPVN